MSGQKKPMRELMPSVAAFIDEMREAFGKEHIDGQIRKGMNGAKNTFYATENGHEIGTKFTDPKSFITLDRMVIRTPEEINNKQKKFRK